MNKFELSNVESQLLSVFNRLIVTKREINVENIEFMIEIKIPSLKDAWKIVCEKLIERGIVEKNGNLWNIKAAGREQAEYNMKNHPIAEYFYDEFYTRAANSRTHSEFCEKAYGINLCQHGMMDLKQMNFLLSELNLDSRNNVLELGCSNGMIPEYIADKTEAKITGIDISQAAVKIAKNRTKNKKDSLHFEVGNMMNLKYEDNLFDTIISIDTLYFVKDLDSVVEKMIKILKPEGKMGIFFHSWVEDEKKEKFNPADSLLGKTLKKFGLDFYTLDFSKDNYNHWIYKKKVLLELKEKFEKEGNMFLYNNRMGECESDLEEFLRFLYIVKK